ADALKQLSQEQQSFRKRVEQSLDRFRRAAADQDFRATAQEARDLADDQSTLAEAMKTGAETERRASQQEGLEKRAQDLKEKMDSLQDDLSRIGEKEAKEGVQKAAQQTGDAAEQMKKASSDSRREQMSDASNAADQAADQLRKSARTLDQVRSQMGQDQTQHLRRAFRQTSTDALSLARRQGELQQKMKQSRSEDERQEIRAEEGAVMQGLKNLQSKLEQPLREAPEAGRPVQNELKSALSSLQQTLDNMGKDKGSGTPMSTSTSQETIASLNRAAQAAAGAAQQGGGQGGGGSGTPQVQRRLQQVAQQQGRVAERTSSLSPMQLGPSALKEMLGKMAGAQEAVGSQVGQLADQPGAGGAMGDLGKMAEEANELADRLRQGRLDAETVQRQNQLFHRLLDAGLSLEKDELSSERQSHTAGAVAPTVVEPLTAEDLGGARFSLPRADVLQALPPAQRALVVQYFERLNRSGASTDQGGEGR
ncbi:MAG TPA: hypothetical protein VKA44_01490, partial [Gemmatimonadota bacterium]|nr:hypothetical protein [Gemmatimonadota bacterium]